MPLRSANGWTANDRSVIASYSLPGGKVALRKGDVSVVLLWCANRWHETVEELEWPGNWGYAERLVRGSTNTISDHASGTALDLNAPAHPLGVSVAKTFTRAQVDAIHAILEHCDGVVGWGGNYRRPDGMHLYIRDNAAAVKKVADKIRESQGSSSRIAAPSRPTPSPRLRAAPVSPAPARPVAMPHSSPRPAPAAGISNREDAMLIKTQPDKTKPGTLAALLSGPMFIGLGPTETPSDEQARQMGLPVLWVEYGTWQDMDRRSHNLCDRPQHVVTRSEATPVQVQAPAYVPYPATTNAKNTTITANTASSPNSPGPS